MSGPATLIESPPDDLAGLLSALQRGGPVEARTVVVVAHPDDETLGLGAQLGRFGDLTLVHVTDGAPPDGIDAGAAGFGTPAAYARARARELRRALAALGCAPRRRIGLRLPDQSAVERLADLTLWLRGVLEGAAAVFSHAYEGGHPDHDATACAVQAACQLLEREGRRPPRRLEFAGYHQGPQGPVSGEFWPSLGAPAADLPVPRAALRRKRAALAAFASQRAVLAAFDPAQERVRPAPHYDFRRPPPPGRALYDAWGWPLSSPVWRRRAAPALASLGLEAPP